MISQTRILYLFIFILFAGCSQSQNEQQEGADDIVTIKGKVRSPQESGNILLEKIGKNNFTVVDTLDLAADSTFHYEKQKSKPSFYRLNFYNKQYVNLILDDEDVEVVADGNKREGDFKVTGSTDTDHFYAVNDIIQNFQAQVNQMNQEYVDARSSGNQEKLKAIEQEFANLEQSKNQKIKNKIRKMDNSIAALYAVNYLNSEKHFPFLDSLANHFKETLPDSRYTQEFVTQVDNMRKLAVGKEAPNIRLPNPEGDTISLKSLRGKYVLIDFWAAWCRPCRVENPNVVRMYNKYKNEGFEIYGVSLDRNKQDWVKAIENDGLEWVHVSDLQYFDSRAANKYNINAIPATFLLDKEGKIIAKNLRGESLENKLKEIFG